MLQRLKLFWDTKDDQEEQIIIGLVSTDGSRCVQCGICTYNCPIGIQVRDFARQGLPVTDPGCIGCGQCINVCPRGTLRWEQGGHLRPPSPNGDG